VPAAVLVRGGDAFYLCQSGRTPAALRVAQNDEVEDWLAAPAGAPLPSALARWLGTLRPADGLACEDDGMRLALRAKGLEARLATVSELRSSRETLPPSAIAASRAFQLQVARRQLASALARPEESLISLAREEERLERALGREATASRQLLLPTLDGPGRRYQDHATQFRSTFEQHHARLREELVDLSAQVAPNLTRLLGSPLAGRLIATAGSTQALARMSGARIQLLGSRRRPSPVRGPRYGHLYRAPRLAELPPGRAGAYARSLAALAAIAARADAITHADIADLLIGRRERRVRALMGRR
jgi:hypothetical protein